MMGFVRNLYHSRVCWLLCYTTLAVVLIIVVVNLDVGITWCGVAGGCLGSLCSGIVLYKIGNLSDDKRTIAKRLLFLRALCDFLLGVRFMTGFLWNMWTCGSLECGITDDGGRCWLPSSVLEFVEISSEGWFICVAWDLMSSVSDPFSSEKAKMKKYHTFAWTYGAVFALALGIGKGLSGFWYVSDNLTDTSFCWVDRKQLWATEVMFTVPVFLMYFCGIFAFVAAYRRLKFGLSKAFQTRVTKLSENTINVVLYIVYWTLLVFLNVVAQETADAFPSVSSGLFLAFIMLLAGKGFIDLITYIVTEDGDYKRLRRTTNTSSLPVSSRDGTANATATTRSVSGESGGSSTVLSPKYTRRGGTNFNAALRQEVLYFATTGIRACAQRASTVKQSRRRTELFMSQKGSEKGDSISFLVFIKLMFGSETNLKKLTAAMERVSAKMTPAVADHGAGTAEERVNSTPNGANVALPATDADISNPMFSPAAISVNTGGDAMSGAIPGSGQTGSGRAASDIRPSSAPGTPSGSRSSSRGSTQRRPSSSVNDDSHLSLSFAAIITEVRAHESLSNRATGGGSAGSRASLPGFFSSIVAYFRGGSEETREERITELLENRISGHNSRDSSGHLHPSLDVESFPAEDSNNCGSSAGANRSSQPQQHNQTGRQQSANSTVVKSNTMEQGWLNRLSKMLFGRYNARVKFTEFEPFYFRLIRQCSGVDDAYYQQAFESTIKETLTEGGASGSFFFYSQGEQFIAKSCNEEEMQVLVKHAADYANYLYAHSGSMMSRIYGAYQLRMYGTDLNFYVMNNVLLSPSGELINEKYDIKGSWVARNAVFPQEGQRTTCKYCHQSYFYRRKLVTTKKFDLGSRSKNSQDSVSGEGNDSGRPADRLSVIMKAVGAVVSSNAAEQKPADMSERCPFTVLGHHEPNVILKDNDLKHKIRIPQRTSYQMLSQLKTDAEFLCSLGLMDYSLLIGVHYTEYEVEEEVDDEDDALDQVAMGLAEDADLTSSASSVRGSINAVGRSSSVRRIVSMSKSRSGLLGRGADTASVPTPSGTGTGTSTGTGGGSGAEQAPMSGIVRPGAKFGSARHVKRVRVSRVVGPETYYFGIVDFQQKWNFSKRFERFLKIHLYGADRMGLSAMAPVPYKERFVSRMEELLLSHADDNR